MSVSFLVSWASFRLGCGFFWNPFGSSWIFVVRVSAFVGRVCMYFLAYCLSSGGAVVSVYMYFCLFGVPEFITLSWQAFVC